LLVDASPDLRTQALAFDVNRVDLLLLTHSHADHVLGLDDVRIYNFRQGSSISCCADYLTIAAVKRMFAYAFDPMTPRGGGLPQLDLCTLAGPFSFCKHTIIPVPLRHGTLPILGYRVGAFAYLTDCNMIPDMSWPLLKGLDVLVLDALRHRRHSTHFSLKEAIDVALRIGARTTFFTHMAHDLPHAETCAALPSGMSLANDGLVITVDEFCDESVLTSALRSVIPIS